MLKNQMQGKNWMFSSGLLLGCLLVPTAPAQSGNANKSSAVATSSSKPAPVPTSAPTRYRPDRFAGRAGKYYELVWGIDSLGVKAVESGELIRFSYRVVDPGKAKLLNDKSVDAFMDVPTARARLVIPSLEKVGQLRQGNTPQEGTSYWMAFSNPRRTVKRGDRVNVVIGQFHAEGLVVE